MKIAAYVHWRRTVGNVTGVGRHMRAMTMGLAQSPGIDVTVMASGREMNAPDAQDTPLTALPRVALPFSRAVMERIWWATHLPKAERYVPDADWVYCAADAFVPTRKALFASTIHDIEVFEDDLPWSRRAGWAKVRRNWRLRLAPIFKHARIVVTVSEFSKQRMVQLLGADPEQIVVVGNGVEQNFFEKAQSQQTLAEAAEWRRKYGAYVVTVGGLSQRKGAPYLFELVDVLRDRKSDLRVLVSGKNDPEYRQRQEATPNVVPLGYVSDKDLPGLLKGAVAMLFLSRYEGFGIPIVEAMACGTPVLVADFASLPEVAGDAGIIVDVNQPQAIAEQLIDIASNPQRRERLIQRGLGRAAQFHWSTCVEKLLNAMKQRM
jgi:glycosyltransferase involved in cell wall biosynthesis